MSALVRAVKYHYSSTEYHRTDKQIKREEWLIPGVLRFRRIFLMPAAVLIQVCCGSLYAWSGYNLPIERAIYGPSLSAKGVAVDRGQASNVFFVAVAVFGVTSALLGPWLERNGPLKGALLGSTLFFVGQLLAALGVHVQSLPLVFFGYGFVGGAGLGISYISPVSPLQKWFPDLRGLASGLAVCGFGAGSIFSPYTQKALIGPTYANTGEENLGVPKTFIILASCYFVIMSAASLVLRMPPPGYQLNGINIDTVKGAELHEPRDNGKAAESSKEADSVAITVQPANRTSAFAVNLAQALKSKEYILMYIMFFCAEITGLLIIAKIQSIVQNQLKKDLQTATNINSALGGCNLLGRLVLPTLSDYVGQRKPFFVLSLTMQTLFLALLPTAIGDGNYGLTLTCAFIIAFFYGGGFGLIPAFLADQFGSKNVGATHGVILTAWALAGVGGGLVFNQVYKNEVARLTPDLIHVYDLNFRWILAFTCLGVLISLAVPTNLRDRRLPKKHGETARFRLPNGRFCRLFGLKPVVYTKAEEDAEWEEFLANLPAANHHDLPQESSHTLTH
ncbi:major facilitator superfamily domain-containing protein [Fimicolochytrium jonesii]|uniref:major facilitator superfamily domain-containing protein n=1 Tax=Fimicolochytrium jonesii TaxID=1396493 RepID=UPI0022FE9C47|nr:major facilitator superfamily domain-containing protein [Fimicolochytrium jonesii]KAI8821339.1 major facilitator superfamily domain-containing protein [Fimicolochytrium jonesii]